MSFFGGDDTDPDGYTTCPYNPLHLILNKRIPYHIAKCRKNFPNVEMETCPYNATHVYPRLEHQHHITHCRERGIIDREIMYSQSKEKEGVRGNCSIPSYNSHFECEERWDEELPSTSFASFQPLACLSSQVQLPKMEPIVLEAETQRDVERRYEERQKNRSVNAPNAFLQPRSATASGGANAPNVAIVSGVNSGDTTMCYSNGSNQNVVLGGIGRGALLQSSSLAPASPSEAAAETASFGRGRALLLFQQQQQQQQRKVTMTPGFRLPGIGRGMWNGFPLE